MQIYEKSNVLRVGFSWLTFYVAFFPVSLCYQFVKFLFPLTVGTINDIVVQLLTKKKKTTCRYFSIKNKKKKFVLINFYALFVQLDS